MSRKRVYYFTFKLWPGSEYRDIPPEEENFDIDDMHALYRYRQLLRHYYLNWFDVVETWKFLFRYIYGPVLLLVWYAIGNWLAGIPLFILWLGTWMLIKGKVQEIWGMRFLVPGLIDSKLIEHFGSLEPFDGRRWADYS